MEHKCEYTNATEENASYCFVIELQFSNSLQFSEYSGDDEI